jgi:hypothetical protein
MQLVLYADLNKRILTDTSSGTAAYSFAPITQGDKLQLGLRFLDSTNGVRTEVQKNISSLRATIGYYDQRPESGHFVLRLGNGPYVEGENQTPPIPFNATSRAVQSALSEIGLGGVTVVNTNGSWIISNEGQRILGLSGSSVSGLVESLKPLSFVRVREMRFNDGYHYDIRLIQSPLASTVDFIPVLPAMPEVARIQEGGEDAFTKWPEIQSLKVLPTFRGTYILKRGYKRTDELSVEDGAEQIKEALKKIADEGGSFDVTNPRTNIAHITFRGSMDGIGHDLIEVVVTSSDAGDPTVTLDTNTIEVAEALRASQSISAFLEVEATFVNSDDTLTTMSLCKAPITIERELNWEGLEAASNVDWLRPPIGETYVPFTRDQVIFGSQHYSVTLTADDYDEEESIYKISHNLGTTDLHVSVFDQSNGGKLFNPEEISHFSENVLSLKFANLANDGQFRVVITTAGPKSAFLNHTHTIDQIVGLSLTLSELDERVSILEEYIPAADVASAVPVGGVAEWVLPSFFEVFPLRVQPTFEDSAVKQGVAGIIPSKLPRGGGLLPAKYLEGDVTVANTLPTSPSLDAVYKFDDTSTLLSIPGYLGRKLKKVKAPAFYAWDGRGFYQVEQVNSNESVYYPSDFSRELFRIPVNEKQLRTGNKLTVELAIHAALFKSSTPVHWAIIIDLGIPTKNPSNPSNLDEVDFLPASLDYSFLLTEVATTHTFGLKVARTVVNLQDTLIVEKKLYGAYEVTDTDLTSPNFVIRGRLARFDTGNNETDPRGLVAVSGMTADNVKDDVSDGGDAKLIYGYARITPYSEAS